MARNGTGGLRMTAQVATHAAGLVAAVALVGSAAASPPPDYGFEWATITHPGNRVAQPSELSFDPGQRVGRVDHLYRISRTEMPNERWFEFVQAYAPYYNGVRNDPAFVGHFIRWNGSAYQMVAGSDRYVATMSWRMAARYANWLHNGKTLEQAAFENGAYDTSTFVPNPDGSINDQIAHHPDARYWIATDDEWVKAMYFDPHKNGQGEAGYWLHPIASDTPAVPGWPWAGGETNAGIELGPDAVELPVGSYVDVQSPWGLWDGSGGAWEFSESLARRPDGGRYRDSRSSRGSTAYLSAYLYESYDALGYSSSLGPNRGGKSFRLASTVPAPGPSVVWVAAAVGGLLTRRRSCERAYARPFSACSPALLGQMSRCRSADREGLS